MTYQIPATPCFFKNAILERAQSWLNPSLVQFHPESIKRVDLKIPDEVVYPYADQMEPKTLILYAILLNSINHQFWDMDEKGQYSRYFYKDVEGARGMHLAFQEAFSDSHSPLSVAIRNKTALSIQDIHAIFSNIPNPRSRADILSEIIESPKLDWVLTLFLNHIHRFGDNDKTIPFTAEWAIILATHFPRGYQDPLFKKAQLAVSEISRGINLYYPGTWTTLTAFADYQIPNVLRHFGILSYSTELENMIDQRRLIPANSDAEKAIRANSILAIEQWSRETQLPVDVIDFNVWLRRKEPNKPFHLTKTTDY